MKCKLIHGTHSTRDEKGVLKDYRPGDTVELSDDQYANFYDKFAIVSEGDIDHARDILANVVARARALSPAAPQTVTTPEPTLEPTLAASLRDREASGTSASARESSDSDQRNKI